MKNQPTKGSSFTPKDESGSHQNVPLRRSDEPHRPTMDWPCPFCPRNFKSPQGLGGHQNTHRKERDARMKEYYAKLCTPRRTTFSPPNQTPTLMGVGPTHRTSWRIRSNPWLGCGPLSISELGFADELKAVTADVTRVKDYMHVHQERVEERAEHGPQNGSGPQNRPGPQVSPSDGALICSVFGPQNGSGPQNSPGPNVSPSDGALICSDLKVVMTVESAVEVGSDVLDLTLRL